MKLILEIPHHEINALVHKHVRDLGYVPEGRQSSVVLRVDGDTVTVHVEIDDQKRYRDD